MQIHNQTHVTNLFQVGGLIIPPLNYFNYGLGGEWIIVNGYYYTLGGETMLAGQEANNNFSDINQTEYVATTIVVSEGIWIKAIKLYVGAIIL